MRDTNDARPHMHASLLIFKPTNMLQTVMSKYTCLTLLCFKCN